MAAAYLHGIHDASLLKAYRSARRFLRRKNVLGLAIGPALRNGERAEKAICILVSRKLPERKLSPRQCFPKQIEGVPTDVIVATPRLLGQLPPAELFARRSKRHPTVVPGIALGDASSEGSVGMIVKDAKGRSYALTCAHVLSHASGTTVFQPAEAKAANRVGTVAGHLLDKDGDAALVALSRPASNKPLGASTSLTGVRPFRPDEILHKSGCMTGITAARAEYVGEFTVEYEGGKAVRMQGFFLRPLAGDADEISVAGDSGSVWFDPVSGAAVGMTVAGDEGGWGNAAEWAFACHLVQVCERLGVQAA